MMLKVFLPSRRAMIIAVTEAAAPQIDSQNDGFSIVPPMRLASTQRNIETIHAAAELRVKSATMVAIFAKPGLIHGKGRGIRLSKRKSAKPKPVSKATRVSHCVELLWRNGIERMPGFTVDGDDHPVRHADDDLSFI